jgi:cupin 2 domain-containing protein
VADLRNLLDRLPAQSDDEVVTKLFTHSGVRVERIVSTGQATPVDAPYIQSHDEWVLLLSGNAKLKLEVDGECTLGPGDCLFIPANQRHWVTWTAHDTPTVWLAIHFPPAAS